MGKHVDKQVEKMEIELSQVTRTKSILNRSQIQKIFNSTPSNYKYKRAAKGGGQWDYVRVSYIRKVLDSIFGFDWDFEVETTLAEAFDIASKTGTCVVKGTLTGRVVDDSGRIRELKKTQFGRCDVKWKKGRKPEDVAGTDLTPQPLDIGNDMKGAATDCLKKCASVLGIAADVYEKDDFIEIIIDDPENKREKQTQKQVEKAKKQLAEEAEKVGEQNQ